MLCHLFGKVGFSDWSGGNIGIGYEALTLNTTGNSNVALGYESLKNNTTAYSNIGIGFQTLFSTTTVTVAQLLFFRK